MVDEAKQDAEPKTGRSDRPRSIPWPLIGFWALLLGCVTVVPYFFYQRAMKELEKSLDRRSAAMDLALQESLSETVKQLDSISDLKARVEILEKEKEELKAAVAEAREAEEAAKTKLKRHLIQIDTERQELETRNKLLEETLAQLEKEPSPKPDEEPPRVSAQDLIAINRILREKSEGSIVVLECKELSDNELALPVLRVENFRDDEPAEVFAQKAAFTSEGGHVRFMAFGGHLQIHGKEKVEIPETGLLLAEFALSEAELTPFSKRLTGYGKAISAAPATDQEKREESLLDKINRLLSEERGAKYQFKSIGGVQGKKLLNVELMLFIQGGVLEKKVISEICEFKLKQEFRTLELDFSDGFIVQEGKERPFYNQNYKLPIPLVDNQRWLSADLDCLTVE